MKRRDFIKITSGAGAAVLTGTAAPVEASQLKPAEMDLFLQNLDQHLDGIARHKTLQDLFPHIKPPSTDEEKAGFQRGDELFRKALRSLLLVGVVHDLPEGSRNHPGIQERLFNAMPEMDEAIFGTLAMLDGLTPADRLDIAESIEDDPGLPMRVIEAIDREGASLGVSRKRRLHLRSLGAQVSWRMQRQSPSTVIDEYVDKAQRMVVQHSENPEVLRGLIARLGENAFFNPAGQKLAAASNGWVRPSAVPPPPGPEGEKRSETPLQRAHRGRSVVSVGAWLLGFGVVVTGAGIALTLTANFWFSIVITIGATLILTGLICLLVGAIIRENADRQLERL